MAVGPEQLNFALQPRPKAVERLFLGEWPKTALPPLREYCVFRGLLCSFLFLWLFAQIWLYPVSFMQVGFYSARTRERL